MFADSSSNGMMMWTPFFGRSATTGRLPRMLAVRFDSSTGPNRRTGSGLGRRPERAGTVRPVSAELLLAAVLAVALSVAASSSS